MKNDGSEERIVDGGRDWKDILEGRYPLKDPYGRAHKPRKRRGH